jgi:hypothetical protein
MIIPIECHPTHPSLSVARHPALSRGRPTLLLPLSTLLRRSISAKQPLQPRRLEERILDPALRDIRQISVRRCAAVGRGCRLGPRGGTLLVPPRVVLCAGLGLLLLAFHDVGEEALGLVPDAVAGALLLLSRGVVLGHVEQAVRHSAVSVRIVVVSRETAEDVGETATLLLAARDPSNSSHQQANQAPVPDQRPDQPRPAPKRAHHRPKRQEDRQSPNNKRRQPLHGPLAEPPLDIGVHRAEVQVPTDGVEVLSGLAEGGQDALRVRVGGPCECGGVAQEGEQGVDGAQVVLRRGGEVGCDEVCEEAVGGVKRREGGGIGWVLTSY